MNLSAALVELHFIHELVDEENSAAVIGKKILADGATGNRIGIEARAGIAHDDEDAALLITRHQAFHYLARIFLGSVNHGIRQSFLQRELDGIFLAIDALHAANRLHHLRHDGVHGLAVRRQRDSHAQVQFSGSNCTPGSVPGKPQIPWLARRPPSRL